MKVFGFGAAKATWVASNGVVAAMPGFAALGKSVKCPPGMETMYTAVAAAVSAMAFLTVWLFKAPIRRWPARRVVIVTVVCFALMISFLCAHLWVHSLCVYPVTGEEAVYFPLFPTGKLKEIIDLRGGRANALDTRLHRARIRAEIENQPAGVTMTTITLMITYIGTFISLTVAFTCLAVRNTIRSEGEPPDAGRAFAMEPVRPLD